MHSTSYAIVARLPFSSARSTTATFPGTGQAKVIFSARAGAASKRTRASGVTARMPHHGAGEPVSSPAACVLYTPRKMRVLVWSVALAAALLGSPAFAQQSSASCPPGNLLARARLAQWLDIDKAANLLVDDAVVAEGAVWNVPQAVIFQTNAASVTYDLGALYPVAAVYLQGDANDTYSFKVSDDGKDFREVWAVPSVVNIGHGMRSRFTQLSGVAARFIRLGEATGDEFYSISELQVFCQTPAPWPPKPRVIEANTASAPVLQPQTTGQAFWLALAGTLTLTLDQADAMKLTLSLYGAALLLLALFIKRRAGVGDDPPERVPWYRQAWFPTLAFVVGPLVLVPLAAASPLNHKKNWYEAAMGLVALPAAAAIVASLWFAATGPFYRRVKRKKGSAVERSDLRRLRDAMLLALGLTCYAGYYNWGSYHFPVYIHHYEFYHYFIGSKYFKELAYTRLYECSSIAEAEQGFRRRVELRKIRDLEKNVLVPAKGILDNPEHCKSHFTPARWEQFKADIAYFRGHTGIDTWEKMLHDHGYNPSPVWNMTGSILANLRPASKDFIGHGVSMWNGPLGLLDPALVLLAFGFIAWAYGWRIACIGAVFFGCNHPALYFWTGGGYLRQDWFAAAMIGLAFLKKGSPALGGAALAYSTLLRVFPGGFFVPIAVKLLYTLWKERRIDKVGARIVVGAALATAVLVPVSSYVAGGFDAWKGFIENTAKHAGTPLTNHMGLRTVVSFRPSTRQQVMHAPHLDDPFLLFKEAHKKTFKQMLPVFLAIVGAYFFLLWKAASRIDKWWVMAAFGFGVIPIATELTCYYFSFLTAAAFLWGDRDEVPIGLLALSGATHILQFNTYYYDVRYTVESVAVVLFVFGATLAYAYPGLQTRLARRLAFRDRPARDEDEAGGDEPPEPPEPPEDKPEGPRPSHREPKRPAQRTAPRKRRHG